MGGKEIGDGKVRSGDSRTTRIRWSWRVMVSSCGVLALAFCSAVEASGIGCEGEMGTGEDIFGRQGSRGKSGADADSRLGDLFLPGVFGVGGGCRSLILD